MGLYKHVRSVWALVSFVITWDVLALLLTALTRRQGGWEGHTRTHTHTETYTHTSIRTEHTTSKSCWQQRKARRVENTILQRTGRYGHGLTSSYALKTKYASKTPKQRKQGIQTAKSRHPDSGEHAPSLPSEPVLVAVGREGGEGSGASLPREEGALFPPNLSLSLFPPLGGDAGEKRLGGEDSILGREGTGLDCTGGEKRGRQGGQRRRRREEGEARRAEGEERTGVLNTAETSKRRAVYGPLKAAETGWMARGDTSERWRHCTNTHAGL